MILIDSNILIDVFDENQDWRAWSIDRLVELSAEHELVVNQIAFAEVAPRMAALHEFRQKLTEFEIVYEPLVEDAAFAAGRAFLQYRAKRQEARMVLPDFFIGGHATVLQASILTRDARFYRNYFPTVPLITPETTS